MSRYSLVAILALVSVAVTACGLSAEEIDRRIDQRVQEALTAVPTATPDPIPTLTPTITPQPTATPQPTPTPITFPETPTPVSFPPTPTPQPTATPQFVTDFNAVQRRVQPSVFMTQTSRNIGTGWLIEPGLILTNEHTITNATNVTIRQARRPSFTATVLAWDTRRDIALLTFNPNEVALDPDVTPLPLGRVSSDDIAQPLLALGYSTNSNNGNGSVGGATANVGVLSQVINFGSRSHGRNLVMDAPVDPGDSGGPVLNANGEVVGMSRAVLERTEQGQRVVGTFYAVHVDEIRAALPALRRGESR